VTGRRRRRALLAAFLAVVLLPLGALAWLAGRLARAEVDRANARVAELATASLGEVADAVGALVAARGEALLTAITALDALAQPDPPAALRELARRLPGVRQTFLVAANGQLAYPSPGGDLDREEAAFLRRTASVWSSGVLRRNPAADEQSNFAAVTPPPASSLPSKLLPEPVAATAPPRPSWYPWHQDDGLHLLVWRAAADGSVRGAELDRVRLLADLVGSLPEADPALARGRFRLLDAEGRVLHQWGALDPGARQPLARFQLRAPLAAWSLEYFDPGAGDPGRGALASGVGLGLAALGLLIVALAGHVYRASSRELADAATRVSFVNQVSHELKTPLTNIRMYAELLATEVASEPTASRYAGIVAGESERLSRLIGNVLTFARHERHELALHRREASVDETLVRVLDSFQPSLDARGVTVETELGAATPCRCDPDAVAQVLGNLLSNVEKYACDGGYARVTTRRDGATVTLTVGDRGPGIAPADRERVFAPFARVSSALTDGVSGAGLGLTIARELARLHGGDLKLSPEGPGATFIATFEVDRRAEETKAWEAKA
jgi:signal transduction histidine kinase